MSEHYFSANPQSEHDYMEFQYQIPNSQKVIAFKTDAGVFSRHNVDFGSNLLIKTCIPNKNSTVLDLGCGYGAIGLSLAARDPSLIMVLSDINQRAVELAKTNCDLNNLHATILNSDGFNNITGVFDYIVFNPPIRAGKEVIYKIISESINHLKHSGEVYIVIRKRQGGASLQTFIERVFGNCKKISKSGGYWILKAFRPVVE